MNKDEISIEAFSTDVSADQEYLVDVNALLGVCGASPINAQYKTKKIVTINTYPESILLASGDNYIHINQIKKIEKSLVNDKISYEITCGILKSLETTIKIVKI